MPDILGIAESPVPEPNRAQREALEALRRSRELGQHSALVVMAPGLGKTHLAAWDAHRYARDGHVLYLAHRAEVQARDHCDASADGSAGHSAHFRNEYRLLHAHREGDCPWLSCFDRVPGFLGYCRGQS